MTVTVWKPWWKSAVVYQVYPASFSDSNGDGIGDIQGIISKLDYIASLGANVIWICPTYDSPQVDMGYDISNYEDVYPAYGTLADMEQLIQECHARGLRIMLDLVINHTSNLHPWFLESRSSKLSPKRDWYVWRPPRYDHEGRRRPPNNWRAHFGTGSAWEWDAATQEYYLHLYAPEQPDLNWENPVTRKAIYASAVEFWLQRGVDGFRIDTVNMYSKPPDLPDAPVLDAAASCQVAHGLYCNGPRIHDYLTELNALLARYNAVTVGELAYTPDTERVLRYVSAQEGQLNMVFQFDIVDVGMGPLHKFDTSPRNWRLPDLKRAVARTQVMIRDTDGWTTVFTENHDQARSVSRFGNDAPEYRAASAKLLAMLQATLSGTLYLYQGQEIGQVNAPLASYPLSQYKDIESLLFLEHVVRQSAGTPTSHAELSKASAVVQHLARDQARIPMAWDGSKRHGGFSDGNKPWMAAHPLAKEVNVADQMRDSHSVLAFWRLMLAFRRAHADLFVHGYFELVDVEDPDIFIFIKTSTQGDKAVVVLNFTASSKSWHGPDVAALGLDNQRKGDWNLEMSTVEGKSSGDEHELSPYEGRVYFIRA